jgi:hypothetical protein
MRAALAVLLTLGTAPSPAGAQRVSVPTIPARPEDVATVDGILKAFYEVISGPAGEPRQWGRDRSLYVPGVRFVSTGWKADGTPETRLMTHQEFVDATDAGFVREGFFETEIHRVERRIGDIVHVFSTYEMHRGTAHGPIIGRGVNSLLLYWDGDRWWIVSAVWTDEASGHPIPAEYLPR